MAKVTVVGSATPCVDLPTGVRKTVEWSRGVRARVRRGYYDIVEGPTEDEPAARLQRNPETLERLEAVTEEDLDAAVEVVVHDHQPGPATALDLDDPRHDANVVPEPPARNASRVKWAEFLTARGYVFTASNGRDDLVAIWETANGER